MTTLPTILHLDGKTAYIRRFGIASHRVKKSEFETLIHGDKEIEVIVCKDVASKYAKRMNRLGYILQAKENYDIFSYKLVYAAM